RIEDSAVGVAAIGDYRLTVVRSELLKNGIGIQLNGEGKALITGTSFRDQVTAGVWATRGVEESEAAATLEISNSHFVGARYAIVLGNVPALLRDNELADFSLDGVLAFESTVDVLNNQIRHGGGVGIRAVKPRASTISGNEIQDIQAVGILL